MKRYKNGLIALLVIFSLVTHIRIGAQIEIWQELLQDEQFEHTQLAMSLVDIDSEEVLFEYNSQLSLIPASSLKVLVSYGALDMLGADYKYETKVLINGEVGQDGTLYGNLIIKGAGDPSLGSPVEENVLSIDKLIESIIIKLAKIGVSCIDGDILVDDSIFDSSAIHDSWSWDDIANYYASGTFGFNIHENLYYLHFGRSEKSNTLTTINKILPSGLNLSFTNLVTTGDKGSGDNAYIYGDPYENRRIIKGTIPPGKGEFKIKGAIPSPSLFFREKLVGRMNDEGIKCNIIDSKDYKVVGEQQQERTICTFISPPLSQLVRRANFESNNLYSETFLKTLAVDSQENPTGFSDGVNIMTSWLSKINLDSSSLNYLDGSGLSVKNRVSTDFLSRFIAKIMTDQSSFEDKLSYLPEAGKEGSVRYFLRGKKDMVGKVFLKSGSMGSVVSYTGVIIGKSGRKLAISLIANGHLFSNRIVRSEFEKVIEEVFKKY